MRKGERGLKHDGEEEGAVVDVLKGAPLAWISLTISRGQNEQVDKEAGHGLGDANNPVGEEDEPVVDKTIAGGARRPLHDVQLSLLVGQGDGRHHVCEQVDCKDGEGGEWQRDSENHPGLGRSCCHKIANENLHSHQKGKNLRDVAGQRVHDGLLQVVLKATKLI